MKKPRYKYYKNITKGRTDSGMYWRVKRSPQGVTEFWNNGKWYETFGWGSYRDKKIYKELTQEEIFLELL